MPDFMETVKEAWDKPVNTQDVILRLHVKLSRLTKVLTVWTHRSSNNWKKNDNSIGNPVVVGKSTETRMLSPEELEFKKFIKCKLVVMAVIQKSKAKQHSGLTWIRDRDTNNLCSTYMQIFRT